MKLDFWRNAHQEDRAEHRAGYTSSAVEAAIAGAMGSGAKPTATSAIEAAVRAISLPFGLARVSGDAGLIQPDFLVDMVRRLMLAGNAVSLIDLDGQGNIQLLPAAAFDVGGTATRWAYQLELPSPRGEPTIRRTLSDGVIHVRVNPPPSRPWQGSAPWQRAKLDADTLGFISESLKTDSTPLTRIFVPLPDGLSEGHVTGVKNALIQGVGAISPLETTQGGFGQGPQAKPKADYEQKRIGAQVLAPNVALRDSTALAILSAYGVSPAALGLADGAAIDRGRRAFYYDVIEPLAEIIANELSRKLDRRIRLDFSANQYMDHQRLSRALGSYRQAGMPYAQAVQLLGLGVSTTPDIPPPQAREAVDVSEHTPGQLADVLALQAEADQHLAAWKAVNAKLQNHKRPSAQGRRAAYGTGDGVEYG